MKKKCIFSVILFLVFSFILTGCVKKKVKVEKPTEQTLTPVTVNDLKSGSYYVKNGDDFYELPVEGINYDKSKPIESTTNELNGITDHEENRIVDFVFKDGAIPILYKNDQIVFKSSGNVPSFTWERFIDQGYSIGLYGLVPTSAGKIQYDVTKSGNETNASITTAIKEKITEGINVDNGFVIDKINGTTLTEDNIREGGIVAGLTKDAVADCDIYIGTTLVTVSVTADMRAFTSFELFTTDLYNNSPDGYAIVDIPDYLKSGYYYINNAGMVKYYNVDRGTDTTDITLDEPYYYEGEDGSILTYYEYMEQNSSSKMNAEVPGGVESLEDTEDVININTDVTQPGLNFSIAYKYQAKEYETAAKQNGKFPKVILVSPTGNATELAIVHTNKNDDDWSYMNATISGAVAGTWQLRLYNFENIYRTISTDIASGNSKSFIQAGNTGRIDIHFDDSSVANDIAITWQNKDHAADVIIRTPDGTEYSKEKTPGNLMQNEYGKIVFKLPNLTNGDYNFTINGSDLGRVWIDNSESVSLNTEQLIPESEAETEETTEN